MHEAYKLRSCGYVLATACWSTVLLSPGEPAMRFPHRGFGRVRCVSQQASCSLRQVRYVSRQASSGFKLLRCGMSAGRPAVLTGWTGGVRHNAPVTLRQRTGQLRVRAFLRFPALLS